jgi:hypothetical protein
VVAWDLLLPWSFVNQVLGILSDMLSLIHTKSIVLAHPTVTCGTSSFLPIIQYLLSNYLELYWLIMLRLVHYFMMAHFVFQLVAYRITLKIYSVLLWQYSFCFYYNMDRPIIIGTLLDPVVFYQLTIQIHPVTTQAICNYI